MEPTKDFILFGAYVCFFPQLVAGPIERANNLIPQFKNKREFDYEIAKDGIKQILWGLFKKVVIADSCGFYANYIFDNHETLNTLTLIIGSILFAFQIYGDFSGYSDIAIGTAKLFGFRLMVNFRYPYFSRDIAEFWRRWHISLSTWFRDYLYIPMGGSRVSNILQIRNTFTIFIVSGLWHGANWTFIIWGALNALYFLPLQLAQKNRKHVDSVVTDSLLPSLKTTMQILFTFALTCFAWIFFRAENIQHALSYIKHIFTNFTTSTSFFPGIDLVILTIIMISIEWVHREEEHPIVFKNMERKLKVPVYLLLSYIVVAYFNLNNQEFIYFQF
jgi:D-alanyl-lipoteichoic acid acyltransferase DltB (MBOAT superfamily)